MSFRVIGSLREHCTNGKGHKLLDRIQLKEEFDCIVMMLLN